MISALHPLEDGATILRASWVLGQALPLREEQDTKKSALFLYFPFRG